MLSSKFVKVKVMEQGFRLFGMGEGRRGGGGGVVSGKGGG